MGRRNKNIIKQKKKTEEPVLKQWEIANYINRQHWVAFFFYAAVGTCRTWIYVFE